MCYFHEGWHSHFFHLFLLTSFFPNVVHYTSSSLSFIFYSRVLISFRKCMHYLAYCRAGADQVWTISHCRETRSLFHIIIKSASIESSSLQVGNNTALPDATWPIIKACEDFPWRAKCLEPRNQPKEGENALRQILAVLAGHFSAVRTEYWKRKICASRSNIVLGISVTKEGEMHSVSSSVAKWKALPSSDLVKQSNHLKCGWEYSVLPCRHRTILSVPEWPQIALFHLFFFLSFPLSCFLFIFPQVTLSNGAKLAANPFDVRAVYMRVLERNQFRLIKSANSRQRLQPARAHVMNTRSLLLQPECN